MDDNILSIKGLDFAYNVNERKTLSNINLEIKQNEFISIIGHNGSGKSTLSKLICGILKPLKGDICIDGIIISENTLNQIRKKIGIVFQNPDNQFIGTTVYDDIEFGLQNYQYPSNEMNKIIHQSAKKVGIELLLDSEPGNLSGGQKQKVAIATIFALKPEIVIFDESTSMLDPLGKLEINKLMWDMKSVYKKTVISITHDMEEALKSDRILVLDGGKVVYFDKPEKVFELYNKKLIQMGLDIPNALKISNNIKGINSTIIEATLINNLRKIINSKQIATFKNDEDLIKTDIHNNKNLKIKDKDICIDANNLNYYYYKNYPSEKHAVSDVSVKIEKNKITAIVGNTGSGKSTFVQHINCLIRSLTGSIDIDIDKDKKFKIIKKRLYLNNSRCRVKRLRSNIGLVFQFPEYQLFNTTVEKEIIFAPINFGIKKSDALAAAPKWISIVKLDKNFLNANPFELSGGQKRKVAIASIISYNPNIIIFDEPTAGLDPSSTQNTLNLIKDLKKQGKTVIVISHEMDQLLQIADTMILFKNGKIQMHDLPENILSNTSIIEKNNLKLPYVYSFLFQLGLTSKKWLQIKDINNLIISLNKII